MLMLIITDIYLWTKLGLEFNIWIIINFQRNRKHWNQPNMANHSVEQRVKTIVSTGKSPQKFPQSKIQLLSTRLVNPPPEQKKGIKQDDNLNITSKTLCNINKNCVSFVQKYWFKRKPKIGCQLLKNRIKSQQIFNYWEYTT